MVFEDRDVCPELSQSTRVPRQQVGTLFHYARIGLRGFSAGLWIDLFSPSKISFVLTAEFTRAPQTVHQARPEFL
jgi:hypothetical protein